MFAAVYSHNVNFSKNTGENIIYKGNLYKPWLWLALLWIYTDGVGRNAWKEFWLIFFTAQLTSNNKEKHGNFYFHESLGACLNLKERKRQGPKDCAFYA